MKKLLLIVALLLGALQLSAADVSPVQARAAAERFLQSDVKGKNFGAMPASGVKLLYTEMNSTQADKAVYYIFNSELGFVIVSGDDRAHQILAHGDRLLDLKRMPENMKFWLSTYKRQLEYLQAHPGLAVELPKLKSGQRADKVEPMLTAEWDQDAPYYNHCPTYGGSYCLTGCPATSLSMVFYYWKFPTDPTPPVEGYTNESYGFQVPALPSITFDWDNMLDKYTGSYNSA
ncbi:MAG: Spi family protease inhibitor, partial [Muribaculaceae bacterium]|nr:Spi family protease inhibitor [Muribaculaceae bacterium]